MELIVKKGITKENLNRIYSDERILNGYPDGWTPKPIDHPLVDYTTAWVGDKFAGCFLRVKNSVHEVECHSLLLKESVLYSRELCSMFVNMCFKCDILRVYTRVFEYSKSFRNMALKIGFVEEGFKRDVARKNGQLIGTYEMAITKRDWASKWAS